MATVPRLSAALLWISPALVLLGMHGRVAAQQLPLAVGVSEEERQKIEAAIPEAALVTPAKRRQLLIFDLNVGYGGHRSIAHANLAFTLLGQRTGAFQTVIARDPAVFQPRSLERFDAVLFNNTVGNLFEDSALRRSLIDFVYSGGGLLGLHGTTVAFTRWPGAHEDWPEFGVMLGARGANHRASDEQVFIKLDDPDHPLTRCFDRGGFDYRDEFFRVHEPYSRDRVRVLLSIDTAKTDFNQGEARGKALRADNDYALAWVRSYGRGRVFYCTIAHNPYVFWDPRMLNFYLAAVQFATGDLLAPTAPSSRLSPATRAEEKLGWRLGGTVSRVNPPPLFEAIDKAAQLGLSYLGGLSWQKVSGDLPQEFDHQLTPDQLERIRLKLDSAGVRLLTYSVRQLPTEEPACCRIFEFARRMGVEALICEQWPGLLERVEKHCDQFDLRLAIPADDWTASSGDGRPERLAEALRGRSQRIGVYGDVGAWLRSGIEPVAVLRTLGERLVALGIHDVHPPVSKGREVPWGAQAVQLERLLAEIRRFGLQPTIFGLGLPIDDASSMPEAVQCIEFFRRASRKLAE